MLTGADPLPSKRRCTESTIASSRAIPTNLETLVILLSTKMTLSWLVHPRPTTTTAEVRVLKAELAKARADAAAAVALAAEREPTPRSVQHAQHRELRRWIG
jgi:hypothetical protein